MKTAKELHNNAMTLYEDYLALKIQGRTEISLLQEAYTLEQKAAMMLYERRDLEPTRSKLFASCAAMAKQLGDYDEMERFISLAKTGAPGKDILEELKELSEKTTVKAFFKIISLNQFLSVTSVAAVLIVSFFIWQPTKLSNGDVYHDYFTEKNLNIPFESDCIVRIRTFDRSESYQFREYSISESKEFMIAKDLFDQKLYNKSEIKLQNLWAKDQKFDEVAFYLAMSKMKVGKISKSIELLEKLQKYAPHIYPEETEYYLSLAYISNQDRSHAKELLRKIAKSNSKYAAKARSVLNDLRWF